MPMDSPVAVVAGSAAFIETVTFSEEPLSASVTDRRSAYAGAPSPASPAPSGIVRKVENGAVEAAPAPPLGVEPGPVAAGAGPPADVPGPGVAEWPTPGL